MRLEIGQTGTMNWADGSTAKVEVVGKETYSFMPTDYWFEYVEGETNKQLVHPDLGQAHIKASILLPEGLVPHIFTPDKEVRQFGFENSFEYKLEEYLKNNFDQSERSKAAHLFKQLERTAGQQYIEDNYLNKNK
jgi:hypothetical protein